MKKISLILVAVMLFSTLTACKSQKDTSSDSSLIESGTLSYSSSETTINTSETQSSESSEANAASSQPSAPDKVEINTSSNKTLPSKDNTSVDNTSSVTTDSSNITSNTNQVPNNDNTSSATNSSESQKTENKIETRTYKTDVFSVEVPVSLDGKYEVVDFGSRIMHLVVPDVDYYAVQAGITIYTNEDSETGEWEVSFYFPEEQDGIEAYTPEAMKNYNDFIAQRDFIISSFKWLI